jgi:hypothetical protein
MAQALGPLPYNRPASRRNARMSDDPHIAPDFHTTERSLKP